MNKIYRVVFNVTRGEWQAVCEMARGPSKSSRSRKRLGRNSFRASAVATLLLTALLSSNLAWAVCSTNSLTVTCSGATNPLSPNYSNATNNLTVTLNTGASLGIIVGLNGAALSLTGNNLILNNLGTIDPQLLGSQILPSSGVVIGNSNSSNLTINNMSNGVIRGSSGNILGNRISDLMGMALNIKNGSSGTTTIINQGLIESTALTGASIEKADIPVMAVTGGSPVNIRNWGTINGRVAFEASSTGNTFTNAGTLNGSLSLGKGGGNNTFNAITGSTVVNAGGIDTSSVTVDSNSNLEFVKPGIVDGGVGGSNTLALKNDVNGGGGTAGSGAISADNFINFSNLSVQSGTWTIDGVLLKGTNTSTNLNGGSLTVNNDAVFGNSYLNFDGGNLTAYASTLNLANDINIKTGGMSLSGSNAITLMGQISGSGKLTKNGTGILSLFGANSYTGGTVLNDGTTSVANNNAFGTGSINLAARIYALNNLTLSNSIQLIGNASFGGTSNLTLSGSIGESSPQSITKDGTGNLILNAANSFTGGTNIQSGTLALGAGGRLASTGAVNLSGIGSTFDISASNQTIGALSGVTGSTVNLGSRSLTFGDSNSQTFAGNISGTGDIIKNGSGTQTLSSVNDYTGSTNIQAGTLALSVGGRLASTGAVNLSGIGSTFDISASNQTIGALSGVAGSTVNLGSHALTFGDSKSQTFAGNIKGSGGITKYGSGTQTLTGVNDYTGSTNIQAGTLILDTGSSLNSNSVTVSNGANLTAKGTINGTLNVSNGGQLGLSTGSLLNVSNLVLSPTAHINAALGAASTTGLVNVTGNLTLLGGIVDITDLGQFGSGTYRLFDFGMLSNSNGLQLGTLPNGISSSDLSIQYAANQINLVVGGTTLFWDGGSVVANGVIDGGTGIWNNNNINWTKATGDLNRSWNDSFAVFQGIPGLVTVEGNQRTQGLQFASDGYRLVAGNNGQLELLNDSTGKANIRVNPNQTAILDVTLSGNATLAKVDSGKLVLNGSNSYTGGTYLEGGTLELGHNQALGNGSLTVSNVSELQNNNPLTLSNAMILNANLNLSGSNDLTLAGKVSGASGLVKTGSGTLTLSGKNTFTGGTQLQAGKVIVAADDALGSGTVTVTGTQNDPSTLQVNQGVVVGQNSHINLGNNSILENEGKLQGGVSSSTTAQSVQVNNHSGGMISSLGTTSGVAMEFSKGGTLVNEGQDSLTGTASSISGSSAGVSMDGASGSVTNANEASIAGNIVGVQLKAGGTVINRDASTITGGLLGVSLFTGGTVVNGAGSTISGSQQSVVANSGGGTTTLTNNGVLRGNVRLDDQATNHVTLGMGSRIVGDLNIGMQSTSSLTLTGTSIGHSIQKYSDTVSSATIFGGTLNVNSNDTWVLDRNLTTSNTNINSGILQLGDGTASGHGSLAGNITNNADLVINNSAATTLMGTINGTGTLTQQGLGTTTLIGTNGYTGGTFIKQGTLALAAGSRLAATGVVNLTGSDAKFDISRSGSQIIGDLSGVAGSIVDLGSNALTISGNSDQTFAGSINGNGALVKNGSSTQILTGINTYTGGTNIQAGKLALGAGGNLASTGALNLVGIATTFDMSASRNQTIGALTGVSSSTVDLGAQTLTFGDSTNQTFAGNIKGSGSIIKNGTGTQILSGINTFTGGTSINQGTLSLDAGGSLVATGALNLAANGTTFDIRASGDQTIGALSGVTGSTVDLGAHSLTFGNSSNQILASKITGAGGITKNGTGTQTLTGANDYTGDTTINQGTLVLGTGASLGTGSVLNHASLVFNSVNNTTLLNTIGGTGDLTQSSSSSTTLAGDTHYTGNTYVNAGSLVLAGNQHVLGGDIDVSTGSTLGIASTAPVAVAGTVNLNKGSNLLINALSTGSQLTASDVYLGAGVGLNISGINAPISVDQVLISTTNGIHGDFGNITIGGFTGPVDYLTLNTQKSADQKEYLASYNLSWTANNSLAQGTFSLNNASEQFDVGTALSDQIANSTLGWDGQTLTKNGAGTLILSGNNSYTGATIINAGTLQVGNGGSTGNLGTGAIHNNGQLVLNRNDSLTLNNDISGTGGFVQQGTGTTVLTGNNSYRGNTEINAGILQIDSDNRLGDINSSLLLNGGTLQTTTDLASQRQIVLGAAGGSLSPDANTALRIEGDIQGIGDLQQTGTGTLILLGNNSYSGNTEINAGTLQVGNGGSTGNLGTGAIHNNGQLVLNRNDSLTLNNDISGTGGFVQQGTGTIVLTGNNSYSGDTEINAGTLQVGNGGSTGNLGTGAINNNGQLVLNRNDSLNLNNDISGTGGFVQQGIGTTVLTGNNSYSGNTEINAGTLQVGNGGSTGNLGTGAINNNGQLVLNRNDSLNLNNDISGTGGFVQQGTGTTVLTGNNSYSGNTEINVGTLQVGNGGSTGNLGTGVINNNGQLVLNRNDSLTLNNDISGTGRFVQQGTGTTVLTGNNSYSGNTEINAGTLQAGSAGALVQNTAYTIQNNAVLDLNGYHLTTSQLTNQGQLKLGSAELTINSLENQIDQLAGQVSGTGQIIKQGLGTLELNAANSFSGGINLKQGRIDLGNAQGLGTGTLAMDDGTSLGLVSNGMVISNRLDMTGTNDPVVDTGSNTATWAGEISGTGFLTKQGTGTLLLTNTSNDYTGATEVAQGVLQAGAVNTFSNSSVHNIARGATLDLAGYSQTLSSLSNQGVVKLSNNDAATPSTILKITGPYVGNNGTLAISTVLDADGSATDKLLLSGANAVASGSTAIQISNAGGLGAQTKGTGIEIVTTENGGRLQSGSFTLAGGHVDAGAYEYRLFQNEQGATLQSTNTQSTPTESAYRNEVPLMSALPAQLRQADLAMLGDKKKRLGDEYGLLNNGTSEDMNQNYRIWSRVLRIDPQIQQQGTVTPQSEGSLMGYQLGVDIYANDHVNAGFYVGQLDGKLDTTGFASGENHKYVGFNSLRSRYLGVNGHWADSSGLYVDAVVQSADYRSHLQTSEHPEANTALTKGRGWSASLEVGKPWAFTDKWQLEPQIQVIYQDLDLDDTSISLATVKNSSDVNWTYRLGANLKGDFATRIGRLQPYAGLSTFKTSNGLDQASFITPAATTDIKAKTDYLTTEIAAGTTLHVNKSTSLYGEIGKLWNNSGDNKLSSGAQASFGVKAYW